MVIIISSSLLFLISAKSIAKGIVKEMRSEFGNTLDILDSTLLVNARETQSEEMSEVRRMLKKRRDEITVSDQFMFDIQYLHTYVALFLSFEAHLTYVFIYVLILHGLNINLLVSLISAFG